MPTGKQDNEFAKLMQDNVDEVRISATALDEAIAFIGGNLDPEDVFSTKDLEHWAESNGYSKWFIKLPGFSFL